MNGCNWDNKSFSVTISGKAIALCQDCKKEIETIYRYNGEIFCQECFSKKGKNRIAEFQEGIFFTDKDKQYDFVTDMFDGKPVQITSKRQFKTLLKQHGLMDASIKEGSQHAKYRKRVIKEEHASERRKKATEIFIKMKERGQIGGYRKRYS